MTKVKESTDDALQGEAAVLIDGAFSMTLRDHGVALESACLIRKELRIRTCLWLPRPDRSGTIPPPLLSDDGVPCVLRGISLAPIVESLSRLAALRPRINDDSESAVNAWLRAVQADRRRFLLHELGPGKPLAKSLADAAVTIRNVGKATNHQRAAMRRAWEALQGTFGGPFVAEAVADTVLRDAYDLVQRLDVWIDRACRGDIGLALDPAAGPYTLVLIVRRLSTPTAGT